MKRYFKELTGELKKIISFAAMVSKETNMPAYLVGGYIRDLILQVKNFDLDITVQGDGIIFAQALAKKLESGLRTHERFGTATLILNNLLKVDIATTRKEKYPNCACLPIVSFGSLNDDLARRDFTINAMAVSILKGDNRKLIDPFGGRDDLLAGRIRILHDLSFRDDPTRILRAIRFEQRLDFKIEPHTLVLLKKSIKNGLLNKVSSSRISDELILMFKERYPLKQIKRLNDLCTLSFISKRLKATKLTYVLFKSIDKEISWFTKNFSAHRQIDTWLIYFSALLFPLSLSEIKKIIFKFGLRKEQMRIIVSYYENRNKLIEFLSKKSASCAQIFFMLKPLSYETVILLKSVSDNFYLQKHIADFIKIYNDIHLCVCGNDLIGLGLEPGPGYQKIFAKVLEAKINGEIKNRNQELALIRKLIK